MTFVCLKLSADRPRMAFIGTASDDDPLKIERFRTRFADVALSLVHLPMTLTAAQLARNLEQVDLVYVGGGDTEKMVNAWRRDGWADVLSKACQSGVILAGVSAGAVCWFDTYLFSSGNGYNAPLAGVGPDPDGSLSALLERKGSPRRASCGGRHAETMPASIAIDDGVAVTFENGHPTRICIAQEGASAYMVWRSPQGATEEILSIE